MENRYEEYSRFPDGMPFVCMPRLQRSAIHASREANWHENLEIQLCEEGAGSVLLDGRRVPFARGETVVVNAGVIHHTGTEGELCYSCLIMDHAFCREAGIDPATLCFETHFASEEMVELFHQIEQTDREKDSPCRVARLRLLALSLLILLREEHTLSIGAGTPDTAMHQNVKGAIQYIRAHMQEKLSLAEIAQALYVNKYVLARQFKAVTRQTVVSYLNSYRCQTAYSLLQNGATVAEAAHACGFTNLPFFAKTFRRYIGVLPSACRKKQ
ncbi:MAG: helix-turn-helix transcriptional regulator [Clostridia bacterium]|nr:helix-turn-helix transcriptional regulator [Clostridia bacterium]